MISHDPKFIFVHIPRTGGSSIEKGLKRVGKKRFPNDIFPESYSQHLTAQQFQSWLLEEYKSYYSFTVVRNPWDRTVSTYLSLVLGNKRIRRSNLSQEEIVEGFYEWVWEAYAEDKYPYSMANPSAPEELIRNSIRPCYDWIADEEGIFLVNEIYRFEKLEIAFDRMVEIIGCPRVDPLPHVQVSRDRKPYTEYYKKESRQLVEHVFAKDVEIFGYKFKE